MTGASPQRGGQPEGGHRGQPGRPLRTVLAGFLTVGGLRSRGNAHQTARRPAVSLRQTGPMPMLMSARRPAASLRQTGPMPMLMSARRPAASLRQTGPMPMLMSGPAPRTLPRRRADTRPVDAHVELSVNLATRMQSLLHREIGLLDVLEDKVADPDLLKSLFAVDHLATRLRRQAESLAVLGGAASRRQWSRPVAVHEVMRAAVTEVEQYTRVKVVPPAGGLLRGAAVADVIHLVAELVENATKFSAPETSVLLRARQVPNGIAIEVEDRGSGILPAEQARMNQLLADPGRLDLDELRRDGRIGLYVVAVLARRHRIQVRLRNYAYGGTQAIVVLPTSLVGPESAPVSAAGPAAAESTPVPFARPAVPGRSSALPGHQGAHGASSAATSPWATPPWAAADRPPEIQARPPWPEQQATASALPNERGDDSYDVGADDAGAGAPATDAPATDAPATDAPATDDAGAGAQGAGGAGAGTQGADDAAIGASGAGAPGAGDAAIGAPGAGAPGAGDAETGAPGAGAPGAGAPGAGAPGAGDEGTGAPATTARSAGQGQAGDQTGP